MADLLDRTVQEVLGVQDKKLNESVKGLGETFKSAFDDLSDIVRPWVKDANSFYSKAEVANRGILRELSDLNGRISGLPSVISSAVDRTIKPLSKMETGLVTVTTLLPEIKDVLGTTRTSILELERLAGENSLQLDRLNDLVESKGPGWDFVYPEQPITPEKPQDNLVQDITVEPVVNPAPVNVDFSVDAPQSNVDVNVNPTPVNVVPGTADFTPNYTDTLNDVVSVITDIREQIQSFSGATAEDIYPNLRDDLSGIAGAIEGFANANLTGGEIDLQGFISDVQEFVVDVSDGLVGSFVSEVVPEMAGQFGDFVDAYTESLLDAIYKQGDQVATAISDIGPTDLTEEYQPSEIQLDPSFLGEIKGILNDSKDGVGQFHEDTILWLENIDERLNKGFVSVSNTVSRSSARSDAISSKGFSDEIDSFDDLSGDTDRISTMSEFGKGALDALNSKVTDIVTGILSFAWVANTIDAIHKDTTDIMQATGLSRFDASQVSTAVYKGVYDRFGRSTFGTEEIQSAMQGAISSGMTSAKQISEASESMLIASKIIPGVMLDFSDGWTKQFMTVEKQGGEYIESTALIVDDLSNKFYVSAQTLEKSVGTYSKAAALFSNDVKSYTKTMNAYLKRVAAEEEAGIANLGISDFLNRVAWTSVDQLTDTDYARLSQQLGITGSEILQFKADLRGDNGTDAQQKAWESAMLSMENFADRSLANFQKSATNAERMLSVMGNVMSQSYEETQGILEAGKNDRFVTAVEASRSAGETDYSQEGAAERATEMANNTIEENVKNIAQSYTRDGFIGQILTTLNNFGIGSGIAGFGAGILGSFTSSLARAGISKVFGLGGGGGGGGLLSGLLGKGATGATAVGEAASAAGSAASAAGTAATSAATAATTAAEAAGTAATAAGTAGTGIIARLGTFFGKTGAKVSKAASNVSGAASKMGKATADFTKNAGTKMGEFAGKAGEAARSAGTKASELAGKAGTKAGEFSAKIGGTKFGQFMQFLASPANAQVAAYGGKGAGLVKALGSKASVVTSVAGAVFDAGAGAHNAKEWLGKEDAQGSIASGVGGLLGGGSGEGGVANAAAQALKWGAIGTAIAPGIGTAIGAVAGGIAGAIGGERIAKGIDNALTWLGEKNDQMDLWMEEKLGGFGHTISAVKNTFKDLWKNVGGGLFKGLGDVVGGVKDGVKSIFKGNFKEGFATIGSGFLNAGKDVVGGIKDAASDIWDDWTLSAEERIKKRKQEVEDLSKSADQAEKKLNSKDKDLTAAAQKSASGIVHTGESIFKSNADRGRKGSADVSGLNSMSFTDYSAEAVLENNKPIEHQVSTANARTAADFGITDADLNVNVEPTVAGVARGPIINDINQAGPENISSPIVDALNTNMNSVVALLEQAVRLLSNGNSSNQMMPSMSQLSGRAPNSTGSLDNTNRTQITNYQSLA